MKLITSVALIAAFVNEVYADWGINAWLGDSRKNAEKLRTSGNENAFPLKVDDTSNVAHGFFKVTDHYIKSMLGSWHKGNYKYSAHYSGLKNDYWSPPPGQSQKGWVAMVVDGRLTLTWEGDLEACKRINVDPNSSNGCTFRNANEYCHRHGGALFFPDDYYYKKVFRPLCQSPAGMEQLKTSNELYANQLAYSKNTAAHYSQVNYWTDLERVEGAGNDAGKFTVRTTSTHHLFSLFNKENLYTGWDANKKVCDATNTNANCNAAHRTIYEYVIATEQGNSNVAKFISTDDFKAAANHKRLTSGNNRGANAPPTSAKDLNMDMVAKYLSKGGLKSQACTIIECSDSDHNKLQDFACDHNNVRPLCVINNLFTPVRACPKALLAGIYPNEYHCGENVHQFLVTAIYGNPGITQVKHTDGTTETINLHDYGAGKDGVQKTDKSGLKHNYMAILKDVLKDIGIFTLANQSDLDKLIPNLAMYLNCMGSYNEVTAGNYQWELESDSLKAICSRNNEWTYTQKKNKAGKDVWVTTGSVSGACKCDCPAQMTFADANAVQATPTATAGNVLTYCCKDGYEFQANAGYSYQTVNNAGGTCGTECVQVKCEDEFFAPESPEQTTFFWTKDRALKNAQGGYQYNVRKLWKHNKATGNAHADQKNIQGKCVPRQCFDPTKSGALANGKLDIMNPTKTKPFDHTGKTYALGSSFSWTCSADTCGSVSATCNAVALANRKVDQCTPGRWTVSGAGCAPKGCTYTAPQFGSVSAAQVANGGNVVVTCQAGYIAMEGATAVAGGSKTLTCAVNTGNATCQQAQPQPVTCVPVTCAAPGDVAGFQKTTLAGTKHNKDTTATYVCATNSCGVATRKCTVVNNVGVWTSISAAASCTPKYCTLGAMTNGSGATAKIGNLASVTQTCTAGFHIAATKATTHTVKCDAVAKNTASCTDPNGACCQTALTPGVCTATQCDEADACKNAMYNPLAAKNAANGAKVTCTCPAGKVLDPNAKDCQATCNANAGIKGSWTGPANCKCIDPTCPAPAAIPHGQAKKQTNVANKMTGAVNAGAGRLNVGEWITYTCDAGYSLAFSHDGSAANAEQCFRQCYNPPPKQCGGADATKINYSDNAPIAVLDPLNCYCKPNKCNALPASWPAHKLVNEADRKKQFLTGFNAYNSVEVSCAQPKFLANQGSGGNNKQKLTCGPAWTSPSACIEIGCPNPRTANAFYRESMNFVHTCKSLDAINITPATKGSAFAVTSKATGVVYAENTKLDYKFARQNNVVFTTDGGDGKTKDGNGKLLEATIKEGAKYRLQCKKGFAAYFNVPQAVKGGYEKTNADSFECTCTMGRWICNHHCRCESGCA
jgi:hypothetical protein